MIRKNANFLTPAEKEAFVRACVLMKADIVNPTAPPDQRYDRWDEYVAIHWMIQRGFAPGDPIVNFGHGGAGSYSFLSWHRYFLFRFEAQLRTYVPGVTLPYWDWTSLGPVMTDDFLGPNGTVNSEVRSGYFAADAPGTGTNPTPAPAWWPAGLTGWRLHSAFGGGSGPLRREVGPSSELPSVQDVREALAMTTYPAFQNALEGGSGLTSGHQMHNGLHGYIGGFAGQMSYPAYSPFEPLFYLHHCNIDRLWAMWQMDGHADEYPDTGGQDNHRRFDLMYPWTGGAAGYGTNAAIATSIPMPDFSGLGAQRNVDTLDFRNAYGYTYDTLAVIGIGLDRTGSMNGLTPDPMVTGAPDVTKWEAARRGVAAFLQDCETVQQSGAIYVMAGVKTFRDLGGNQFDSVFPAPGYGLVKSGSAVSRAAFDSAAAGMTAAGGTPLADALEDVHDTLVEPPFGRVPADERRYLAMLTDGLLTSGSPMSSIPDGGLGQTAVFAMGFGTGAEVDYPTLAAMVAKGLTLPTTQVFQGTTAGAIDKFYSNALARAIGFTTIFDPVLELFEGEHAHFDFLATSADDCFLVTAQGMDFDDGNWAFHLQGPDGHMAYGGAGAHGHGGAAAGHASQHGQCRPEATVTRASGRLSLVLQRNNADDSCWVGRWRLMVAYRARELDAMVMPTIGELLLPVTAGTVRGPRFSRLLKEPATRKPMRSVKARPAHRLDTVALGNNREDGRACSVVVNVYGRSRLRMDLHPGADEARVGKTFAVGADTDLLRGSVTIARAFARLVAPAQDLGAAVAGLAKKDVPAEARLRGSKALKADPARVLALLEQRDRKLGRVRDEELTVVPEGQNLQVLVEDPDVPGDYHVGLYVEGSYCPDHRATSGHGHGDHDHAGHAGHEHAHEPAAASACGPECAPQPFARLLTTWLAVPPKGGRRRR